MSRPKLFPGIFGPSKIQGRVEFQRFPNQTFQLNWEALD